MMSTLNSETFKRYMCLGCGFLYDEALGLPEEGIAPGTRWADVPDTYCCPDCGTTKALFEMVEIDDAPGHRVDADAPLQLQLPRVPDRTAGFRHHTRLRRGDLPRAGLRLQHAPHHNFVICAFVLSGTLTHVNTKLGHTGPADHRHQHRNWLDRRARRRDPDVTGPAVPIVQLHHPADALDATHKEALAQRLTNVLLHMEGDAATPGGRGFATIIFHPVAGGDWWIGGHTDDTNVTAPGRYLAHVTIPEGYMNQAHKTDVHAAVTQAVLDTADPHGSPPATSIPATTQRRNPR